MAITKMNIKQATRSYEGWMRSCATIIESHVRLKHTQMKSDPFMFLRGTFYRWPPRGKFRHLAGCRRAVILGHR
jgi:hypothetical protein